MRVRNDVARKLLSVDRARQDYGVVLSGPPFALDHRATDELRESMRRRRKPGKLFDFGGQRGPGRTRVDG